MFGDELLLPFLEIGRFGLEGLDKILAAEDEREYRPRQIAGDEKLDLGERKGPLLGALVSTALLFVIALFGRGSMGFGDVKYGTVCGAAVGLGGVLPMLAFTFVAGAAVAAFVLLFKLRGRRDVVPFTPFLFAGVLFSVVWSPSYLIA